MEDDGDGFGSLSSDTKFDARWIKISGRYLGIKLKFDSDSNFTLKQTTCPLSRITHERFDE